MVKFQLLKKSIREISCLLRKLITKHPKQVTPGIDENRCITIKAVLAQSTCIAEKFIPLAAKDSQWVGIEFLNPNFRSPLDEEDDNEETALQELAIDPGTDPIFLLFPGLNRDPLVKAFETASTSEVTKHLIGQKANFCKMKNPKKSFQANRRLKRVQEEKYPCDIDDAGRNNCLMTGICQILNPKYHTTENYYFGTPFNSPNFRPTSILKYLYDIYSYSDEDSCGQYDDEEDEDSEDEVCRHRRRRKRKSYKKCYPIDESSSLSINEVCGPIESSSAEEDYEIFYIDNRKKGMTRKLNKTVVSLDSCLADEEDSLEFTDCKKRKVLNKKKMKSLDISSNECGVPYFNEIIIEDTFVSVDSKKQSKLPNNNDSNASVSNKGGEGKTLACSDCKRQSNVENKIKSHSNGNDAPVNIDNKQEAKVECNSNKIIDECRAFDTDKVKEGETSMNGNSEKTRKVKNKKNLLGYLFQRKWIKKTP